MGLRPKTRGMPETRLSRILVFIYATYSRFSEYHILYIIYCKLYTILLLYTFHYILYTLGFQVRAFSLLASPGWGRIGPLGGRTPAPGARAGSWDTAGDRALRVQECNLSV